MIRRASAAAAFLLLTLTTAARGQLVPITRCQAAIPCSIPYGLRPADAAAWTPGARIGQGNTAISVRVDERLKPEVQAPNVSEDPTERAARIFMRKNPLPTPKPTSKPTPAPKPG
ncbi:MAG TPA: hypothetical protein VH854_07250 [Thermoanaerobaculia bacterium]|nr:hypothetical protein [Thermoanaerobaculia bacterium]